MIDWKTSAKKKRTIEECYDYPLQLVAYAGAVNHNPHLFDFKVHRVGREEKVARGAGL